ncbi:MFS transporter [Catenulispora sp. NL8]|uniref:MFS transporter n=1 Tax=Catenulispora pinistramenti TaxID=2705254 RepID=A0ABS5KXT5_9ACTN|nr:MFS transporter [Catenulispora pinistramenti]MBS2550861.1 MFS transporter [Catenulispora pinistramenti]
MRKWLPLVAVCLGTFMLLVDVTIVTVALPDMARSLHTTFADLQWVMDIYALVLAALLLAAGSLGDRAGHRKLYVAGLVVFAGASLACGLAGNPGVLIAFRAVQGIGGAAMLATTVALISHLYSGRDLGTAFGVWGAVSGAAAAAGPIMGGLLTQHLDWRWIFFVNLPISVLAVAMTLRYVGESRGERRGGLDLPGLVTFTAAAGLATYALIKGNDYGWGSARTIGVFAGAGVALVAWIAVELKGKAPMLDLSLFRRGTFTGVMIGALLLSGAAFSYFAYESLWLQSTLGMGPVTAGLCFLPMSGAAFLTAGLGGRLLADRVSPGLMIGGGLLLIAAGSAAQMAVGTGSSWTVLVPGLAISGVGVGLATPTLVSTAVAAVGYQRAGMASGAVNTARQLGNALGIAVLGVVFHAGLTSSVRGSGVPRPVPVADALAAGQGEGVVAAGGPAQRPVLEHMTHAAFASGLQSVFLAAALMGAVGGLAVLALVRRPSTGGGHGGGAKPGGGQAEWSGSESVPVAMEL